MPIDHESVARLLADVTHDAFVDQFDEDPATNIPLATYEVTTGLGWKYEVTVTATEEPG